MLGEVYPRPSVRPVPPHLVSFRQVAASESSQLEPLVITENGEAEAVMGDTRSYKQTRETKALPISQRSSKMS